MRKYFVNDIRFFVSKLEEVIFGFESSDVICMRLFYQIEDRCTKPATVGSDSFIDEVEDYLGNCSYELEGFKRDYIAELLFENCVDCEKMPSTIPQAAFAVHKIRENNSAFVVNKLENKNSGYDGKSRGYTSKNCHEGRELTPLKYNSKLMNSIWGLYNRYSVHNFKKIDANEVTFAASWGAVFNGPPSSIAVKNTSVENPQILGTGNAH